MRRALVGLAVAGGLIAIVYLGWSALPLVPVRAAGESTWQLRELAFLKAAYDRMQQEPKHPTEARASLYAEQERIVRQMVETAKLLPAETVPAELRALLPDAEPMSVALAPPIETIAADSHKPDLVEAPIPDLRVGLRVVSSNGSRPAGRSNGFAIDPDLRDPIAHDPAPEPEERGPRRKPGDTARGVKTLGSQP
jgi:hypothetical protein